MKSKVLSLALATAMGVVGVNAEANSTTLNPICDNNVKKWMFHPRITLNTNDYGITVHEETHKRVAIEFSGKFSCKNPNPKSPEYYQLFYLFATYSELRAHLAQMIAGDYNGAIKSLNNGLYSGIPSYLLALELMEGTEGSPKAVQEKINHAIINLNEKIKIFY